MDSYHPPNDPNENDPTVGSGRVVKSKQIGSQSEGGNPIEDRGGLHVPGLLSPEERRLAYLRDYPRHRRFAVPGDPTIFYKLVDQLDHPHRWLVEVNFEHHVVMPDLVLWAGPAHQEFRRILGKQCDLYPESIPHAWWYPMVYISLWDDHDGTEAAERVLRGHNEIVPDKAYEWNEAELDRLADELDRHEERAEGRFRFFMPEHGHGCRCGCEGESS